MSARRLLWFGAALAWAPLAVASPEDVERCLAANDVPCAERELQALSPDRSRDPDVLAAAAHTAFYGGRYFEAAAWMKRAVEAGYPDPWDELGVMERTAETMADWAEVRRDGVVVRYRPGVDFLLIEDAIDAIRRAEKYVAPLLGGPPPGPIIVELYPDGRSFIACSSLTEENVRTTGVVALSKWSRLLVTSPRALGRGYPWRDTLAHEYIHLVVSHRTNDQTPVWLQEAIAKYLDSRWPDGRDRYQLSVREQGLLAAALAGEAGQPPDDPAMPSRLVTFDEMHPSLAKLPSAEMAALAYAQVATMMAFAFEKGGDDVLREALPMIRDGEDSRVALAKAAGYGNFAGFERDWRAWVATLDLKKNHLEELPTTLDGADAAESDPVLDEREDLANYVRLGDLLQERGHFQAALVEYAKAETPEEPNSPLLSNRVAQAHLALGDLQRAKAALRESLASYPEFALTHKTLGQILQKEGDAKGAVGAYLEAASLNPFDPAVQAALVALYTQLGDAARASRHEAALRILKRGGPDPDQVTLLRPSDAANPTTTGKTR